MGTKNTGGPLSAAAEAEHIRMVDKLWDLLRELNVAHDSVNQFYASDNSHQADTNGWRALKPYAAVQHALRASLRELCGGNEEQAEWLADHLIDNGEDVAHNLAEMRQEWAYREEQERISRADDLLIAYEKARDVEDRTLASQLWSALMSELSDLIGDSLARRHELVREALDKRWFISDFLDDKRQEWAELDAAN
ncbi:hypothetical protein [Umezawaea sp. Da 62-37]|uniref:hypothetical protein n=1 Tax=Umezawaea sp. Da 62-37 TaxID=3075927 RepID=UPI0028F6F10D|nr:hypothetical protein [Umezawaea sp. Da 62-37]WNV90295.1 hypothetical protein RM788_19045 [Umezawaea sp. Da 62-37]